MTLIGGPLNILVCHKAPLVCAGIAATLRPHSDIAVTQHDQPAQGPWRGGAFEVVVTDYDGGLRCAEDTSLPQPGRSVRPAKVLIVTDQCSAWEIRHAIASGVHGYLMQDCAGPALEHAVRTVARGSRCFDDTVSGRMAESLAHAALTLREHEVLRLLASGCGNKTIAQRLNIAVGTVKAHIKAILEKLQVSSRMQAAALAAERGLLRVPPMATAPMRAAAARRQAPRTDLAPA